MQTTAVLRAMAFALAVDGWTVTGIEQKGPLPVCKTGKRPRERSGWEPGSALQNIT